MNYIKMVLLNVFMNGLAIKKWKSMKLFVFQIVIIKEW